MRDLSGKVVMARSNVTATEHPLASMAGSRAFQRKGNAFDAAVAASFALAVVQPQLNGPGGDFFGLLYSAKHDRVFCLNSSGWSPSSLTVAEMTASGHRTTPEYGHGSVVIPGYVRGVYEMHRKFGSLEFSDCLKDAIALADDGFPAGEGLVRTLTSASRSLSKGTRKTFFRSDGVIPVGGLLRQRELATCFREIARDGADGFYAGSAASAIREEMSKGGIVVEEDDLASYAPEWCEPLKMDYNGTEVFEVPPNSMGATTLLMLKLLQEERTGGRGLKPNSAERIKRTVAAAKIAYAAKDAQLGDPRFMRGGFSLEEFLRVGSAGAQKQTRIDDGDTTYFAVADDEGNLLSCIQSLFHELGSRVYVEKCGFFLNNRGSSFKLRGGGPNVLEPRKRPLHTLSSLILTKDDRPYIAVGAKGGDYRPQQHTLFVTNIVDYSMSLEKAIDYPRFLWEGGDAVKIEQGYTGLDGLRLRKISLPYPGPTGVAQGAERMSECVKGVCDVRGEGLPSGN